MIVRMISVCSLNCGPGTVGEKPVMLRPGGAGTRMPGDRPWRVRVVPSSSRSVACAPVFGEPAPRRRRQIIAHADQVLLQNRVAVLSLRADQAAN
jgi:hypothetical protein